MLNGSCLGKVDRQMGWILCKRHCLERSSVGGKEGRSKLKILGKGKRTIEPWAGQFMINKLDWILEHHSAEYAAIKGVIIISFSNAVVLMLLYVCYCSLFHSFCSYSFFHNALFALSIIISSFIWYWIISIIWWF